MRRSVREARPQAWCSMDCRGEIMKKIKTIFIAITLFSGFINAAQANEPSELSPYLEGGEHTISTAEYGDLKAYVERAQKTLVRSLETSTAYSGVELRRYLVKGIEAALASSGLRSELMLFKYALERALVADGIYVANPSDDTSSQLSVQVILLPAIESALKYYQTSDAPRLASTVVPSPDWLTFAAEQVPHLLRAIDLAPVQADRAVMAKTALGWTARALNSSLDRRSAQTADFIVQLGELYNDPAIEHPSYVARAEDALLAVYKANRPELKVVNLAPASTGDDLKMRRDSRIVGLPLFDVNFGEEVGSDTLGPDNKSVYRNIDLGRLNAFVGIGMVNTSNGASGKSTNVAGLGNIRAIRYGTLDATLMMAQGEATAYLSPSMDADWKYSAKAQGGLDFMYLLSGVVAVEKSNFGRFEENLIRGGWSPQIAFRIGHMEYVLLQGMIGGFNAGCSAEADTSEDTYCKEGRIGGFAIAARAVIQKKRFSFSVDASAGWNDTDRQSDLPSYSSASTARVGVDSMVTIPMGLLFRNDALVVRGEAVNYSDGGPSRKSALLFYGLNW